MSDLQRLANGCCTAPTQRPLQARHRAQQLRERVLAEPIEQLRALGALAERAVSDRAKSLQPTTRQRAHLDDWEDRGEERAAQAQLEGKAVLPLEQAPSARDPAAIVFGVRETFAACRRAPRNRPHLPRPGTMPERRQGVDGSPAGPPWMN